MKQVQVEMKHSNSDMVCLEFRIPSLILMRVWILFITIFVSAILGIHLASEGLVLVTGTNIFLLSIIFAHLVVYQIGMQYLISINFNDKQVVITKRKSITTLDWEKVIQVKYTEQVNGYTHFWVKYKSDGQLRSVYFNLFSWQSPLESPNKYELLLSEFGKRVPTKTFLHVW